MLTNGTDAKHRQKRPKACVYLAILFHKINLINLHKWVEIDEAATIKSLAQQCVIKMP